jgi:protein SCO1/2
MSLARFTRAALALASLAAALTLTATAAAGTGLKGIPLSHPVPAPDFTLRDQGGKFVRLASLRGRFVIVTFLYTHCPDVCPLIASRLNTALRQLGKARGEVRVLAISVDPRGDTKASVRRFVAEHRLVPEFRYLTGTRAQLEPIWKAYHLAVLPGKNTVAHSAFEVLVDRGGSERVLYDTQVRAEDVVSDLRTLGLK